MKNLKPILTILMGYCFLCFGCQQVTKSIDETFHPKTAPVKQETQNQSDNGSHDTVVVQQTIVTTHSESHTQVADPAGKVDINVIWNVERLKKAEKALRDLPQYAGKEIFVYQSAYFYNDGRITLMLRHPTNPQYVDSYEYSNGKWSEPKPKPLSVHDDIASNSMSLNSISFTSVANVMQFYNEKAAHIEGAEPTTDAYLSISNKRLRWFPDTITGSRGRYTIQFNNDGTIKSFVQE